MSSVGEGSSVGAAHIPRFVPPLQQDSAKRPNPFEQQRIKLGIGTGPVHLAVAVPPPHQDVLDLLKRREQEKQRTGPERPSTAARMRTMVSNYTWRTYPTNASTF